MSFTSVFQKPCLFPFALVTSRRFLHFLGFSIGLCDVVIMAWRGIVTIIATNPLCNQSLFKNEDLTLKEHISRLSAKKRPVTSYAKTDEAKGT